MTDVDQAEMHAEIEVAWAEEIESRCEAVNDGTLPTSDWNEVRVRIERDIFHR
jgi:hypothetical protein